MIVAKIYLHASMEDKLLGKILFSIIMEHLQCYKRPLRALIDSQQSCNLLILNKDTYGGGGDYFNVYLTLQM